MNYRSKINHVIFDWNGTLVDDLALAVKGVNAVRDSQMLPPLNADLYRQHFGFPIRSFYQALGIDCESVQFDDLIKTYLNIFNNEIGFCPLHHGALSMMQDLKARNISISVLSASQHQTLQHNLDNAGISHLVDHVYGLTNTQAMGKQEIAQQLDRALGKPGNTALMIGDTDHDIEIARLCGWQMASVSHGHQTDERLRAIHAQVFDDLPAVHRAWFTPHREELTC
ncbi:HAD family hydrolase [Dickeya sp. CFBP 2040]|uniref:phosphoglycolate phosphatase n=1 Tax=Dickeya poaceiphila TaxID=568768 RepID=A0A5B8I9H5_9GAMM|nr:MULTISPECIES: HAD hydrolase-like protein [Dickeya]NKI73450.1 HAD family hydrolase [Dickeya sp. CFBP 2040]QDX31014.1 HAD family hydrolase [Dickeya poaceiphila]